MKVFRVCNCSTCRLERNEERLMEAEVRVPAYLMDAGDEEKVAAIAVSLPTFGVMK